MVSNPRVNALRFEHGGKDHLMETLSQRVHDYFKSNEISPYANFRMWTKTAIMLLLYFGPYTVLLSGLAGENLWLFFGMWFIMAWGMVGLGTSVMHDAHHGSYSSNKKINNTIGYILEFLGGFSDTWKIQHNELHHPYTNIAGMDEDMDSIKLLRFSPRNPLRWYHRYQFIYAWGFYMLMSVAWITNLNYIQAIRYARLGLLERQGLTLRTILVKITLAKVLYYVYMVGLLMLFSGAPWYHVVLGFFLMHFTAGLFLSSVFQSAHIIPSASFALPVEVNGVRKMERSWAVHELENTANFAPDNKLLTWFIGGLNYQIEHHLFTGICHVHYPNIAPIVKKTVEEYGLTYNTQPTFLKAIASHARMLHQLGRN